MAASRTVVVNRALSALNELFSYVDFNPYNYTEDSDELNEQVTEIEQLFDDIIAGLTYVPPRRRRRAAKKRAKSTR